MPGIQEFLLIAAVILVLWYTGLWPIVMRGFRELRGERVEPDVGGGAEDGEIYFRLLGISSSATWSEIEAAYRQKAKIHHPDHGGDPDAMRTLNEAYTQLKRLRGK